MILSGVVNFTTVELVWNNKITTAMSSVTIVSGYLKPFRKICLANRTGAKRHWIALAGRKNRPW